MKNHFAKVCRSRIKKNIKQCERENTEDESTDEEFDSKAIKHFQIRKITDQIEYKQTKSSAGTKQNVENAGFLHRRRPNYNHKELGTLAHSNRKGISIFWYN
jgi:hypothetical protein